MAFTPAALLIDADYAIVFAFARRLPPAASRRHLISPRCG